MPFGLRPKKRRRSRRDKLRRGTSGIGLSSDLPYAVDSEKRIVEWSMRTTRRGSVTYREIHKGPDQRDGHFKILILAQCSAIHMPDE